MDTPPSRYCFCHVRLIRRLFYFSEEEMGALYRSSSMTSRVDVESSDFNEFKTAAPVLPLNPFAAVYVRVVILQTGMPFIVEINDASSGMSLSVPKYSFMNVRTAFASVGSISSIPENKFLYAGALHTLQI